MPNNGRQHRALVELPAPAKINRFLHVTGRRADGYHELETLFQFLEFADTLRFEMPQRARIRRIDRHDFPLPAEDLTIRAAKLLRAASPEAAGRGATITLRKVIPPGSGLGGGSSNAATTLLALNHLWQLGLTRRRLAGIGLQLGADVPLFVHGRAALAGGIGEALEPSAPTERWLCVCLPPVAVSTARVFSDPRLKPRPRAHGGGRGATGNDLEAVTTAIYPQVAEALARLRRYGDARMSGSGAAVYAGFDSRAEAQHAAAQVGDLNGFVTRSVNRHPLLDFPAG